MLSINRAKLGLSMQNANSDRQGAIILWDVPFDFHRDQGATNIIEVEPLSLPIYPFVYIFRCFSISGIFLKNRGIFFWASFDLTAVTRKKKIIRVEI